MLVINTITTDKVEMMHRFFYTAAASVMLACMPAQGAEWLVDLEAAKDKARAEGKLVLVDFTGSDWCGWCIYLRSNILDTAAFQKYAADKFVLMEVDVPKNVNKIGAELHARNREITKRYGVSTFPTMLVLSPEGDVMGGFVGGRDAMEYVVEPLDKALDNYTKTTAARKLQGEARARALMEVYNAQPDTLKQNFRTMRDEIAEFDPNNSTGIHTLIAETNRLEKLEQIAQSPDANYRPVLKQFDAAYAEATDEFKAKIQRLRLTYLERLQNQLVMNIKTTDDVAELKNLMLIIADYSDARDAAAIKQEIETMFQDPQEVLKTLKKKQQAQ